MSCAVSPDIPDLQGALSSSIGALLIGAFFSICFFGANSLQTWYYYQHYPTDTVIMKAAVACVWISEVLHTIFLCHAVYFYVVLGFGRISVLDSTVWSMNLTIVVTALLTLTAHIFFAWRIYILSRARIIPFVVIFLGIGHTATSGAVAGIAFGIDTYSDIPRSWENLTTSSLALEGVTDLIVAFSLGYYLHHARSGIIETDKLINKLIFWAVNVGILTSIADFTVMALVATQHTKNMTFIAVYEIISNLYAASMLATLNIRQFTREHVLDEHGTVIHLASFPAHVRISKSVTIVSDARDTLGESRYTAPAASLAHNDIEASSETKGTLHNGLSDEEVFQRRI
ncbi:hypothetical protein PTI98_005693 [Pleurotus ostreatus]|nr:hypothetical protein PTI98_005693 [Pleurotus ostreatus]